MANNNKEVGQRDEQEGNRSKGEGTPIYLTADSTLQSPEEHAHDKQTDPKSDRTMEPSSDDLHEVKAGKLTGRDTREDNNK